MSESKVHLWIRGEYIHPWPPLCNPKIDYQKDYYFTTPIYNDLTCKNCLKIIKNMDTSFEINKL